MTLAERELGDATVVAFDDHIPRRLKHTLRQFQHASEVCAHRVCQRKLFRHVNIDLDALGQRLRIVAVTPSWHTERARRTLARHRLGVSTSSAADQKLKNWPTHSY